MSKQEKMERGITIAGILLIVIWMCFLFFYQYQIDRQQVIQDSEVIPMAVEGTLDGYEEEADLIAYMLYQIENQNLDYGLRGCATEELAEYFSMTDYLQYTEQYPGPDLIPPADYGSPAYHAVSVARLTKDYAVQLDEVFQNLASYGHLELLSAEEEVPENPDGKYYENQRKIEELLGARSVREMRFVVQTDSGTIQMRWTLARYKKYWKLLLFHPMKDYLSGELVVTRVENDGAALQSTNMKETDILPCNYRFVNDCSEEDPEKLVRQFLLYLQKQDVWSALTYYHLYEQDPKVGMDYFQRLDQAAVEIQKWLYYMFLPMEDQREWYMQEMKERAEELLEELTTAQMIFVDYGRFEVLEYNDAGLFCQVEYSYDGYYGWLKFYMIYQDGWKIVSMGE